MYVDLDELDAQANTEAARRAIQRIREAVENGEPIEVDDVREAVT